MCGLFEYSRNDENKEDFFFFFCTETVGTNEAFA
jgi:hypothetical protein